MSRNRSDRTKTDHNDGCAHKARKDETMFLHPMDYAVTKTWTDEQKRFLLAQHECMYIEDIAEAVSKTVKATKDKAFLMGCSIKSKPQGNT